MPLLARIVCGGDALNECGALAAKHWHIMLHNRPHESVVDGWVLVSELISEVHDSPRPRDCIKDLRGEPGERRGGFSDDDELTFDRRADEAAALIPGEIEVLDRRGDRVA